MHPNAFQTLPPLPSKRPALPAWGTIPPRPVGISQLRLVLTIGLNYPKPVTSISQAQRPVIDLTNSRSPTPDNRSAPSETSGLSNSRPQLRSISHTEQEMNGRQDNLMNPNPPSARSTNDSSIQVRTSSPHQVMSNTSGEPSVSPKTAISEPPLGQVSPKREPLVTKDRHDFSVNRLLV
jgi:hypothetical protein